MAALLLTALSASTTIHAAPMLVEEGKARAEIVIAERPTRSVRLAAHELQRGLAKISGAHLAIVTEPSGDVPVQVFLGESRYSRQRGVSAHGLKDGAYRIVSGPNWLVLVGHDEDFEPTEPWAKNNNDITSGRLEEQWRALSGVPWGAPAARMYKHRLKLPGPIGIPDAQRSGADDTLEVWSFDERGTLNAVCAFLRRLGMRWYMPGELGEVAPSLSSIALEPVAVTERPDVAIRRFNFPFGTVGAGTAWWAMRLGLRDPFGVQVAHGLSTMTRHPKAFEAHPEWFALYGGHRDNAPGQSNNQLCLSHEGLVENTVRLVRAQLDRYPFETVSVMPPDGFTRMCECSLCAGKASEERGPRGHLSDYVWGFVNRVAREVKKTHSDRKVMSCAYGSYSLPPERIRKLESNVSLCIVGGRRPFGTEDERRRARELREAWAAKTDNPILVFENYPFTARGAYLPAFASTSIGQSINATKQRSWGEDIWVSSGRDFATSDIGFNHFIVYFTARMYWGGPKANIEALVREYCLRFYGPAADEMVAFFAYSEANWQQMAKDAAAAEQALALFAQARHQVQPTSVYGRRLALLDAYLDGLRKKAELLRQERGPVPNVRLVGGGRRAITVDGVLDEDAWTGAPTASAGVLRELQTGREPTFGTSFKVAWSGSSLYIAVRSEERPGEPLNVPTKNADDRRIFDGDVVEMLIETDAQTYYQIAVNPSGALLDIDRGAPEARGLAWTSQAEVATRVADDHWTVELRIPVTDDDSDPLHQVIGQKPTQALPWHINVGRRRIRDDGVELSAFSPTGTGRLDVPIKFAHLYAGRSFQFEVDARAVDYVTARASAAKLQRRGDLEGALAAFATLAASGVSEAQRSDALQQAATVARLLQDDERATALAALIPVAAVRKTTQAEILLDDKRPAEALGRLRNERLERWPFWARGAAYLARGRAHAALGDGWKAEADLVRSLEWTNERARQEVWLVIANNREERLHDDEGALAAYRSALGDERAAAGSASLNAVLGAARVLIRTQAYDEAVVTLGRVDTRKLSSWWRGAYFVVLGEAHAGAGRAAEARAAYEAVLADGTTNAVHRKVATERLDAAPKAAKPKSKSKTKTKTKSKTKRTGRQRSGRRR